MKFLKNPEIHPSNKEAGHHHAEHHVPNEAQLIVMHRTGTVSFINPVKIQYHLIHVTALLLLRFVVLGLDELSLTHEGTAGDRWPMSVLRSIAAAIAIKSQK